MDTKIKETTPPEPDRLIKTPVPIFIIVHDRLEVLKKAVKSFEEMIETPIKIIFHDVASTYEPCLKYLQEMKAAGYTVYRTEKNNHVSVLSSVKRYLKENPCCQYYVGTDPDIELDNVNGDILEFYAHIIEEHGRDLVVGPMLRIDDIPDYYPHRKGVLATHRRIWKKPRKQIKWGENTHEIIVFSIDTTFQLAHRSNTSRFFRSGIRCLPPYAAKHLDWYIDPANMSPDQVFYNDTCNARIAHWGRNIKRI